VKEGLERGRLVSYGKMADQLRESALYETVPLMTSMLRDGFMHKVSESLSVRYCSCREYYLGETLW
jgi:hypothetical protein